MNADNQQIVNANDIWSHAISAEATLQKKSRMAELVYIRELFERHLPVGTDTSEIDAYLDMCEQELIEGNELKNEDFPPPPDYIDPETGHAAVIKYNSASLLKQHATSDGGCNIGSSNQSKHNQITDGQDMEHSQALGGNTPVQDESKES